MALFGEAIQQPTYEPIKTPKQTIYASHILAAFTQNWSNGQIRYLWLDKQKASEMRMQVNRVMSTMIDPCQLLCINDKRIGNQEAILNMQVIYRRYYSIAPKYTPPAFVGLKTQNADFLEKCTADELNAFCNMKGYSLKDLHDYNEFYPEQLSADFREFLSWTRDNELDKKFQK